MRLRRRDPLLSNPFILISAELLRNIDNIAAADRIHVDSL